MWLLIKNIKTGKGTATYCENQKQIKEVINMMNLEVYEIVGITEADVPFININDLSKELDNFIKTDDGLELGSK